MSDPTELRPPLAEQRAHLGRRPGDLRDDPFQWLRDREDPAVRAYLEAENAYTEQIMAPTAALQQALYDEMLARIREDDQTVPVRRGPFLYYSRTVKGHNYRLHCRRPLPVGRPEAEAGPEEVFLDQNTLAQGQSYFSLGDLEVSSDHRRIAYTVDTTGDERHGLRIRDLPRGEDSFDGVEGISAGVVMSEDGRYVLYTRLDDAHRPFQVWRHEIGTSADLDVKLFEETDDAFFVGVGRTRSRAFITISSHSKITSEVRLLPASDPLAELRLVEPRRIGVEYGVEHHGDRLLIVTNLDAVNFRVVQAPIDAPQSANWRDVVPHDPAVKIDDVDPFEGHLVISRRREGIPELLVVDVATGRSHVVAQAEPVYLAQVGANPEFSSSVLRFGYTSLVTPYTIFDYRMDSRERTERKRTEVIGYDPSSLVSERIYAVAPDGVRVPISLVRRADARGPGPMLLHGYGSYGHSYDAVFSAVRLSLLERGITVAIAHVRGGGELGRPWYDAGKLLSKRNTFTDFIACAEALIEQGYTVPEQLAIEGGSAGGLLVGAVVNVRPDLFTAAIADVAFVDNLNTMLDPTLPLTITEYEEWGNPAEEPWGSYIESYAPYENVRAQRYPAMLMLAGWSDPRVQYWEPAKFVARLRITKTGDDVLLLKTNLDAGHGGSSGRYEALRDSAFEYAFLLRHLGLA